MTLEGFVHCKSADIVKLPEHLLRSWNNMVDVVSAYCKCAYFATFKEVSNVSADGTASGVGAALSCSAWLGLILELRADTCLCVQSHRHQ